MRVEVLNTGSELLLGGAVNTHLAFLGQQLFTVGLRIERQVCVGDGPVIGPVMQESFSRCEVFIVTGGLGPTSDDITRELVAEFFGLSVQRDEAILAVIKERFAKFGRQINASIARQADVPRGMIVLPNPHGTAPGLYLPAGTHQGKPFPHIFLLPGPPRELRPMVLAELLPRLRELRSKLSGVPEEMKTLRIVGLGESHVEELVGAKLLALPNLELGYCARSGEVDVRLIGPAETVARAADIVRSEPQLREHLVSEANETMEEIVVKLLRDRGATLATAESCTGGFIANRITNVPGSSKVFVAGPVTYANSAKVTALGVDPALLEADGAPSEAVARTMAEGVQRKFQTDFSIATTGVAGPDGGTAEVPVGTVFIAVGGPDGDVEVKRRQFFASDRESFKRLASQAAFYLLRRKLLSGQKSD
jgi:nicotinamide-nucleotide amidase